MNSLDGVRIVGLTGQTGAGKSTVSKIFAENGFVIIDADKIARQVMQKGSPCLAELTDCFTSAIIDKNGELNRKILAATVFSDRQKLEMLNTITYPYITGEILREIRRHSYKGENLIVLDAPTLFESHADDFCELIISVIADAEERSGRIIARDGLTDEQALNRMKSQHDEQFFIENSDFIINNNKDLDNIYAVAQEVAVQVKEYINKEIYHAR